MRVPGLEAQRRGVGGHGGSRLVMVTTPSGTHLADLVPVGRYRNSLISPPGSSAAICSGLPPSLQSILTSA
jgi:hypothetical protein